MNINSSLRSELVRNLVRANGEKCQFLRDGRLKDPAGGALFVHIWEFFITLDDEVEYIWSKPHYSWVKWIFLFMRYFTFLTQFVNRSVDMAVVYDFPLSLQSVRIYYMLGVVVAQIAVTAVEAVMMVRVYALYGRSKFVKYTFIGLVLASTVTMLVGLTLNVPEDKFRPSAIMLSAPASFAYFGVAALVSQIVILVLSLLRWTYQPSAPLIRMMAFDGTLAFIAISFVSAALLLCSVLGWSFSTNSYAWLLCLISVSGCRLILNIQRLPVPLHPSASASLQLTSIYPQTIGQTTV